MSKAPDAPPKVDVTEPVLVIHLEDYSDLHDALHHPDAERAKQGDDIAQKCHEKRLKKLLGEDTFEEASGVTPKVDVDVDADEPRLEWRPLSEVPF